MYNTIFVLLTIAYTVTAAPLQNITLPLPLGTSNHGHPGLLCTPTKWTDLASFYLFNYVAHAATVILLPGERSIDFAVSVIGCLLFPALGLYRGVEAIVSGAVFARGDLRKAAWSGALCMVVRSQEWRPVEGERVGGAVVRRREGVTGRDDMVMEKELNVGVEEKDGGAEKHERVEKNEGEENKAHLVLYSPPWMLSKFGRLVYVHRQVIHGTHELPPGYQYAIVPSSAQFTPSSNSTMEIASAYNLVKVLVALAQTGYASLTLYRSRGDQIERFGYAAFGLTVAPYAVMSVMNLIGNLCRPDYASLYLVDTSIMDEARRRGGVFEGTVARLVEEVEPSICSCSVSTAVDIEDLTFASNELGKMTAYFNTTSPPILARQSPSEPDKTVSTVKVIDPSYQPPSSLAGLTWTKDYPPSPSTFSPSEPDSTSSTIKVINQSCKPPDALTGETWTKDYPPSPSTSSPSIDSNLVSHTYQLSAPLPKHNYATTRNDTLLLLPSCNPLRLSPHNPLPDEPSPRWTMRSITLTKIPYTWFSHIHQYAITFHPHTYTPPSSLSHIPPSLWRLTKYILTFITALLPLLITGLLSHGFQPGSAPRKESANWKSYTVQWLVNGVVMGLWWVFDQELKDGDRVERFKVGPVVRCCLYVASASSAVGGLVVVGQMLGGFGSCVWVGG